MAVAQVGGNPKGPPLRACSNMTPGKAHQPNTLTDEEKDNPPFQVELKRNKFRKSNSLSTFLKRLLFILSPLELANLNTSIFSQK